MKCATHPEQDATGYCRTCGKPLCAQCTRQVQGALYCENCLASLVSHAAPPAHAPGAPNPAVAAALGFIPGLGAIYNGEYVKGLVHIAVFAGIIAILNTNPSTSIETFFGIGLACFYFYMPIEAYRTALMKQHGGAAAPYGPPPSSAAAAPPAGPVSAALSSPAGASFFTGSAAPASAGPPAPQYEASYRHYRNPIIGAVVLIALGVLILLANMGWLEVDWLGQFWPVILIIIGAALLYKKLRTPARKGTQQP